VAGFDETTLRSGPAGEKKYVHGAFTERYSAFWLGTRSLDTMEQAGILPGFAGIVVSDRYQNYFHPRWEHIAGNQACLSHLLRDYEDCAETYPAAVWPVQAQRALRGLIHAWHAAREQGLPAIPDDILKPLAHEFRHAVLAGLASVPRVPGPKNSTKQRPAASCWNSAATAAMTCCGSPPIPASGPRRRPQRRSPAHRDRSRRRAPRVPSLTRARARAALYATVDLRGVTSNWSGWCGTPSDGASLGSAPPTPDGTNQQGMGQPENSRRQNPSSPVPVEDLAQLITRHRGLHLTGVATTSGSRGISDLCMLYPDEVSSAYVETPYPAYDYRYST
jgi:hypothetical protein